MILFYIIIINNNIMGIERFFSSIEENKITNLASGFTKTLEKKLSAEYFLIDFNSIVYITKGKVLYNLNKVLYKIITNKVDPKRDKKLLEPYNLDTYGFDINHLLTLSPQKYSEAFDDELLSDIIIDKVVDYLLNALENYIDKDKLRVLYIAIDGVPSKSKMIKQKKRRYMGSLVTMVKEKIFDKHKDTLKNHETRYTFEQYKLSWATHNITPGTKFMEGINTVLSGSDFELTLKEKCKNLDKYILSGPYEPGEGENKIVNYLRSVLASSAELQRASYVVYSPDSDVILLSLILNTQSPINNKKISPLTMLRHNQQKNTYDVIDIDKLSNNIFTYVKNEIGSKQKNKSLDKNYIIKDIVLLLTLFGNDFMPKIDALNPRYDFTKIIDIYINVIKKDLQLIRFSKKEKKEIINFSVLLDIIKQLQIDEGGTLQKIYMDSHYQNYNKLKDMFSERDENEDNFIKNLNDFLATLRQFNYDIRKLDPKKDTKKHIKYLEKKWLDCTDFINKMIRLTRLSDSDIRKKNVTSKDFINDYIKYYLDKNKLPKVMVAFKPYYRSIEEQHYKKILEKSLDHLDPNLPITDYDKEIFQFENMLDIYIKKLNAQRLNLGYIAIDPNTYTFKTEKIIKGVERYYEDFFDITNIDIGSKKMSDLLQNYIEGFFWVFEYYFNNFSELYHRELADIWFYPYSHAPLLTQIYYFMKKNINTQFINKINKKLSDLKVDRERYFNCLEQLMYVSPKIMLKSIAPPEYQLVLDNKKYYPELNKVAEDIFNSSQSNEIDCRGVIFIANCHLSILDHIASFKSDEEFIKMLRKIELSDKTFKLTGNYYEGLNYVHTVEFLELTTLDKLKK